MKTIRAHLGHWSRITAWVMLLATLAPTLSHAWQSARGVGWIEVCTSQGARWIANDDSGRTDPASVQPTGEHCPLCTAQAQVPVLLPATAIALPEAPQAVAPAQAADLATPARLARCFASPRGPPPLG